MAGGWVCTDPDCKKFDSWQMPTSSLVKSNFKFTKDKKPICNRCWNAFRYGSNNGVKDETPRPSSAPTSW